MIKDLNTLKSFFRQKVDMPVLGVGVNAFNRVGLEKLLTQFEIICLRYHLDTDLIAKDVPVMCLEKGLPVNKHILGKRNATTILKQEYVQNYLNSFNKKPALIFYKTSSEIEKICQKNNWIIISPPKKFGKETIENKVKFRKILEKNDIPFIPGEIQNLGETNFKNLWKKYKGPFVVQLPDRGGGKGTFFINSENDYINLLNHKRLERYPGRNPKVVVTKFIKGPSPSITACVTRHGILSTNLQNQILDAPELYNLEKGSGLFCGHDWSSTDFSKKISKQAYQAAEKVGQYLQSLGYKGIFGLDFIIDTSTGSLYTVECNPRLLGSFPTLTMVQLRNNEVPILAFHLLEFLDINYELDLDRINSIMRQKKLGAQMILHNLSGRWSKTNKQLLPGIYRLEKDQLVFKRPAYSLKNIKEDDEFLLIDGVPLRGTKFSCHGRIMRILTLRRVLDQEKRKLNLWASKIAARVYSELELNPIRFYWFRRLLSGRFFKSKEEEN